MHTHVYNIYIHTHTHRVHVHIYIYTYIYIHTTNINVYIYIWGGRERVICVYKYITKDLCVYIYIDIHACRLPTGWKGFGCGALGFRVRACDLGLKVACAS